MATKKPKATTKADAASSLISSAQCPKCAGRHVIENAIRGRLTRMCGACGHFWDGEPVRDP